MGSVERVETFFARMMVPCQLGQYERTNAVLNKNICHFLGPSPSAISGKKSKAQKYIQMQRRCTLDVFSAKRARWRSRVLDFPQDSRIRVNLKINSWRTCVKANLFLHWRIFKNVFKIRSERIHDSHSISIMKNFFRFRLLVQILDSGPSGPSLLDRPGCTV